MMDGSPPPYRVNELTPDPAVTFDPKVVKDYVTYAHRIANRGLVNSSVGGMVIRVPHPNYPDGVCYAKPQGISLEEVVEDVTWSSPTSPTAASSPASARPRSAIR